MFKYNNIEEWNIFNIIFNYYFVFDLFDEIWYNMYSVVYSVCSVFLLWNKFVNI